MLFQYDLDTNVRARLSITEWKPVTGSLPPMSAADWDSEFTKYKASPEFKQLNSNMDLSAFKQIYWMEWTHRLWGRVIGLTTLIPTIYFIARKRVSFPMARNLVLINLGIVSQGVVGWWMVASGLKDDLFAKGAHPRVSQYRLATHLSLAFTVYSAMLWNGLQILRERHLVLSTQPGRATAFLERLNDPVLKRFRIATAALTALVCVTVVSGALVAGLDAGLIYNEFPWMGNGLTPPKSELFDPFYSRQPAPHSDLWWRNLLENPSLVQLDHRILATTTFVAINALFAYARFSPHVRAIIPRGTKMALTGVLGMAYLQVTLGLTTLLYLVPTTLAAAHQAGALVLLSTMVVLGSRAWTTPRLRNLVRREYLLMKGRHGQLAKKMSERKAVVPKVEANVA
jgi:cytochrome c oxidase assembly protein subunit 15